MRTDRDLLLDDVVRLRRQVDALRSVVKLGLDYALHDAIDREYRSTKTAAAANRARASFEAKARRLLREDYHVEEVQVQD